MRCWSRHSRHTAQLVCPVLTTSSLYHLRHDNFLCGMSRLLIKWDTYSVGMHHA